MSIDFLNGYCSVNKNGYSVYDFNHNTIQQLLCEFFTKINECVDSSNKALEFMEWVKEEGLPIEVVKYLNQMLEDGTLADLINKTIFEDLNSRLENKMNKDEVLSMANMGQDIKENFTGGSVAIVGKYSVLNETIVDKQVNPVKTTFVVIGDNLFKPSEMVSGFIDSQGNIQSGGYVTSPYIKINGESFLKLNRLSGTNIATKEIRKACFFDGNMTSIQNLFYDNPSQTLEAVPLPAQATFVRVSYNVGYNDSKSCLHFGNTNIYKEYEVNIDDLTLSQKAMNQVEDKIDNINIGNKNIIDKTISYNKLNFVSQGDNLLDPNSLVRGFVMDKYGVVTSHANYCMLELHVENGEYIAHARYTTNMILGYRDIRKVTVFDKNGNVIPSAGTDDMTNEPYLINDVNATKVVLSLGKGYVDDGLSMVYKGNELKTVKDFVYNINKVSINNQLFNKKIIGFGDSIMRGAGNNNFGIVDIIAKRNNMHCVNLAVSGATIMQTQDNNIPKQIDNCTETADYVALEGYINDCLTNDVITNLGEVSPYFSSDFGTTTFCGQLETMLRNVHKKFLGAKIVYIFVHKMGTRDNEIVKQVHAKAKEICKKWSIPTIDLYEESILNTYIDEYKVYTGSEDKTHPNQLGYDKFYIPKIESKLKVI